MLIYLITNTVNGKVYVGQTTGTVEKRWWYHCNSAAKSRTVTHLTQAIRKYGAAAFRIEQISEARSLKELDVMEAHFISHYRSMDRTVGYNMTCGGDRVQFSQDVRDRISQSLTGKTASSETRAKMSATQKAIGNRPPSNAGQHHSEETIRKIAEAHRGRKLTAEHRAALVANHVGRTGLSWSEEEKAKLSESQKERYRREGSPLTGRHSSDEARKNIKESWLRRGRTMPDTTRKKISESHLLRKVAMALLSAD